MTQPDTLPLASLTLTFCHPRVLPWIYRRVSWWQRDGSCSRNSSWSSSASSGHAGIEASVPAAPWPLRRDVRREIRDQDDLRLAITSRSIQSQHDQFAGPRGGLPDDGSGYRRFHPTKLAIESRNRSEPVELRFKNASLGDFRKPQATSDMTWTKWPSRNSRLYCPSATSSRIGSMEVPSIIQSRASRVITAGPPLRQMDREWLGEPWDLLVRTDHPVRPKRMGDGADDDSTVYASPDYPRPPVPTECYPEPKEPQQCLASMEFGHGRMSVAIDPSQRIRQLRCRKR